VHLSSEERVRRGRIVRKHQMVGLLALLVIIPLNFIVSRQYPWWLWVLIVWLPLIIAHSLWARGVFDRRKEGM
jgi:hypothetical protein